MREVSKMARIKINTASKIRLENVKEKKRKVPNTSSFVTSHVLRKWSEEAAQGHSKGPGGVEGKGAHRVALQRLGKEEEGHWEPSSLTAPEMPADKDAELEASSHGQALSFRVSQAQDVLGCHTGSVKQYGGVAGIQQAWFLASS